jgi:SAM-dependent methyltransferase
LITARIGDPATHRRVLGPVAARRVDARIAHLPGGSVWRTIDVLDSEPDATFGTLVALGAFCGADDLDAAIATARRVLGPGGRLLFLEHGRRPGAAGLALRGIDPVWSRLPLGCHVRNDLPAALRRGGFVVSDLERCTMPSVVPLLRPWVQGVAVSLA